MKNIFLTLAVCLGAIQSGEAQTSCDPDMSGWELKCTVQLDPRMMPKNFDGQLASLENQSPTPTNPAFCNVGQPNVPVRVIFKGSFKVGARSDVPALGDGRYRFVPDPKKNAIYEYMNQKLIGVACGDKDWEHISVMINRQCPTNPDWEQCSPAMPKNNTRMGGTYLYSSVFVGRPSDKMKQEIHSDGNGKVWFEIRDKSGNGKDPYVDNGLNPYFPDDTLIAETYTAR